MAFPTIISETPCSQSTGTKASSHWSRHSPCPKFGSRRPMQPSTKAMPYPHSKPMEPMNPYRRTCIQGLISLVGTSDNSCMYLSGRPSIHCSPAECTSFAIEECQPYLPSEAETSPAVSKYITARPTPPYLSPVGLRTCRFRLLASRDRQFSSIASSVGCVNTSYAADKNSSLHVYTYRN
jgi:hypothetical protein